LGIKALVLESQRAGQVRKSYCTTDKISAVKLGRIYLSGLAHVVWQPDTKTRERREVFLAHNKAVTTSTRLRNRIKSYLSDHCVRLGKGARLTQPCGRARVLGARAWSPMQRTLLEEMFHELSGAEQRRKNLRAVMAREILSEPCTLKLLRLMGVRHVVAFGLVAVIGDIRRFATPRKLVAYLGLIPSRWQSGNTSHPGGLSRYGRGDVRTLLIQSAHNAMNHPSHPLHKWGWKLMLRKGHRNVAVAAVARKIAVSVWYLLNGFLSPLSEVDATLRIKIQKLATALGLAAIKEMGYQSRKAFEEQKIQCLLNTA
jgi:transposase